MKIKWPDFLKVPLNLWNVWPSKEMEALEPKDITTNEAYKGVTNQGCPFFPCHEAVDVSEFNCLFCYCPLAFLECPGDYEILNSGGVKRKDCSSCTIVHNGYNKSWNLVQHWLKNPVPWTEK